jgi:hypothetical protein
MNDKFNYPIFPDRMYSIELDDKTYRVLGAVLISAYALYGDLNTLPKEIKDQD